jgi:vancomycin permeability regulator SanA
MIFLLILLLILAAALLMYEYYLPPVKKYDGTSKPYGLLLGCPCHNDGSLSRSQKKRCKLAQEAYEKSAYDTLVISGGAVKNQYAESVEMAKEIQKHCGVKIICEDQARNTFENFAYAKEIIQDASVLILCSDLHARRSCAIARQFFEEYQVLCYPDHKPKHIFREMISRAIYIKIEIQKKFSPKAKRGVSN